MFFALKGISCRIRIRAPGENVVYLCIQKTHMQGKSFPSASHRLSSRHVFYSTCHPVHYHYLLHIPPVNKAIALHLTKNVAYITYCFTVFTLLSLFVFPCVVTEASQLHLIIFKRFKYLSSLQRSPAVKFQVSFF